jgi:uncharacterized protein
VLIVVSPAKSLDFESKPPTRKWSEPRMLDQAAELVEVMRQRSPDDLCRMMDISPQLAELNFERFQSWEPPFTPRNARPALLAFSGDVYQGMDPVHTFGERDYTHAQKTLRILSGLYGVLRPLDLIQPYRLEMGSKVATDRGSDLYDFWGSRITRVLDEDLAASPGPSVLINLASNEYFNSVHTDELQAPVISPVFLDRPVNDPDGEPRIISFFAKRARGAMAGWIIRHRVKSVRALVGFDEMGYRFDTERSTASRPVFAR